MTASPRPRQLVACLTVLVLFLLSAQRIAAEAESEGVPQRSLEECGRLGYQREVVRCSHCETLLAHTGSTELHLECLSCCTAIKERDEREVVYTSAKIVTPFLERMLASPSYISRFVRAYEKEPYFQKLAFVDAGNRFSMPELVLLSDGEDELHISLFNVEAHQVHELLQKKLKL